jgi:hypothetical protein
MIDFENVYRLWHSKVEPALSSLDGIDIEDSEEIKGDKAAVRTVKAEVSRQLLELADTMGLIESLIRNEYWYHKGKGVVIEIGDMND